MRIDIIPQQDIKLGVLSQRDSGVYLLQQLHLAHPENASARVFLLASPPNEISPCGQFVSRFLAPSHPYLIPPVAVPRQAAAPTIA